MDLILQSTERLLRIVWFAAILIEKQGIWISLIRLLGKSITIDVQNLITLGDENRSFDVINPILGLGVVLPSFIEASSPSIVMIYK